MDRHEVIELLWLEFIEGQAGKTKEYQVHFRLAWFADYLKSYNN
jgi:hypothetical protein